MNWIERIENKRLQIITGDGRTYEPIWQNARFEFGFNFAEFNFVGEPGTLIDRRLHKGARYAVEFVFQGEDNIDVLNEFLQSAKDPRPWTLRHPLYDDLTVQPLGLNIDNSLFNISRITGTVAETIEKIEPETITDHKEEIKKQKEATDEANAADIAVKIKEPKGGDVLMVKNWITSCAGTYADIALTAADALLLDNLVFDAVNAAGRMLEDVNTYAQKTIALINFPFMVAGSFQAKYRAIKESFDTLKQIFVRDDATPNEINNYTGLNMAMRSTLPVMAINSPFKTRPEVYDAIKQINDLNVQEIANIDETGAILNPDVSFQTERIINLSLGYLFNIAFNTKQERNLIVEKDTNPVVLAFRFYGAGDDALDDFINENELSLNEMIQIPKGRRVVWYV